MCDPVLMAWQTVRSHVMAGSGTVAVQLRSEGLRWLFRGYSAACARQGMRLPIAETDR
jgi:hypothetical protein